MVRVYENVSFSKQGWYSDGFELRNPAIQKMFWWKCATSIVERIGSRARKQDTEWENSS